MAITIKNNLIIEDILNENGEKIGEIKFNPNDSRIMNKLTKIVNDLSENLKELENIGDIPNLSEKEINTIEDFEKEKENFDKITKTFEIESRATCNVISSLKEVFGNDTIDCFAGGIEDIELIKPLIEFIKPYIQNARAKKVEKYINKQTDVME